MVLVGDGYGLRRQDNRGVNVPGSSGPNGTPGSGVPVSVRYLGGKQLRERAAAFTELPTTLLDRVRWLFVLVGIVAVTISVVEAPGPRVPRWPDVVIGVVALASLGLWMIATYRRPDKLAVEVLPPIALVIAAVALRDPSAVIAPLLAVLLHRVLNDPRPRAIFHSGLYVAAYVVAALLVGGAPRLLTLGSVNLIVGVVSTALIGNALRDVLERDEELRRREVELNAELSRREELFRGVVEDSSDVIAIIGRGGALRFVSPSAKQVLGYAPEDILGRQVEALVHDEDVEQVASLLEAVEDGDRPDGVFTCRLRHRDGGWRVTELSIGPGERDGGSVVAICDVTERKRLEDEIRFRAFHDPLTGLANRALFTDRLGQALSRASHNRTCVGVAFIDLDDFKAVNDNLGHAAGDELLVRIAARMREQVRTTDTAARLGGDEFALLLEGISDAGEAVAVVQRATEVLGGRIHVAGNDLPVNASIGIAVSSDPGSAAAGDELMRNADIAMYEAKNAGKNRYAVFEPDMHVEALERFHLRADLALAVDGDEFVVNYQPIVDLTDRSVVGAEALVRWMHPTRGLIRPSDFIPLAEESGLTVPIGRWVMEMACRAAAEWQRVLPAERRAYVSVNLSARQLHRAELVDEVLSALTDHGLDPALLVLEVTETALTHDPERATATLTRLREIGVRIAIDDFGTGYSSFRYLQLFPVDILKVDRSFVSRITDGPEEAALAHAIVKLGQTLGFDTVAEGIEHSREEATLRHWNCQYAQGYLYAPPLPHDVALRWITAPELPSATQIALPAPGGIVIPG